MAKINSFINRKRPAVEGLVEDLLGPASQLDELISGNPLPGNEATKAGNEDDSRSEPKKEPG